MIEPEKLGPRGGKLESEKYHPQWRREEFHGDVTTLHRFEKTDSSTNGRKNEQAWHRMAAYMILAGRTNSEIAAAANVNPSVVSHLKAQHWFQQLLGTLAANEGEAAMGMIMSEVLESVNTAVEIRDDVSQKGSTRLAASLAIIDHAIGKPVQKTIAARVHNPYKTPQEEYDELKQQLASLRNKEP